jgi:NADH-quinone oxidoreductase subunit G
MDEIAQDTVLNVSERGDRALIGKFEGKEMTHAWAGNVIDLCPVGALLSKDSLNKARSWELDHAPSICTGCSQGCNISVDTRDNMVVRLRPRPNEEVNKYFMCDTGRLDYRWINRQDRIEVPLVRRGESLVAADWDIAIPATAALLDGKRVFVAASPNLSNETLHLLSRLMGANGGSGAFTVKTGPEAPLPGVKDLSLRAERAANGNGAELLGFKRVASPLDGLVKGDVLIVADADLSAATAEQLALASTIIVIGTVLAETLRSAAVVLPIANSAEEDGTFTNLRGRVQRFMQAKAAPGMSRPSWWVVGDILAALGKGEAFYLASEVFSSMASDVAAFAGMNYDALGMRGLIVSGGVK